MTQLLRIFAAPLMIASVSAVGLVAALIGDGWMDWLSWLGLGAPIAVIAFALTRASRIGAKRKH